MTRNKMPDPTSGNWSRAPMAESARRTVRAFVKNRSSVRPTRRPQPASARRDRRRARAPHHRPWSQDITDLRAPSAAGGARHRRVSTWPRCRSRPSGPTASGRARERHRDGQERVRGEWKARITQGSHMGPMVYAARSGCSTHHGVARTRSNMRLHVDAASPSAARSASSSSPKQGDARVYSSNDRHTRRSASTHRPSTVRAANQGITMILRKQFVAAVAGMPYCIPFGDRSCSRYAADVDQCAGRRQARTEQQGGAQVLNLGGSLASMQRASSRRIERQSYPGSASRHVRCPAAMPLPEAVDADGHGDPRRHRMTPLAAIRSSRTSRCSDTGLASGRLDLPMGGVAPSGACSAGRSFRASIW